MRRRYATAEPDALASRSAAATAVALIAVLLASVAVFEIAEAARPAPWQLAQARLDSRLDQLAGTQAARCGDQTRGEAIDLDCAHTAMLAHRPFRMVRRHQGIDSAITVGYAGDSQGRLWEVVYLQSANWPDDDPGPLPARRCWFPDPASEFLLPCK
jgi:hypothetical protein